MARERNVLAILFKNIINSLKPRRFRGDLMGQDYLGNKYYEISGATKKSTSRWFEPIGGEKNFEQDLPAEWEAWLRGRRQHPPTEEEIQKNLNLMKTKLENYRALEAEFKGSNVADISKPPTGKVPFPKLEGYESYPGRKDPSDR